MRKALLVVLSLALTSVPAEARHYWGFLGFFSTPHAPRHQHHHHGARRDTHARVRSYSAEGRTYTTAELVPPDWQLQPNDATLKGQRFVSPDGKGSLVLYATPAQNEPIAKHMNAIAFVEGEQITHLQGEKNWIEVSGLKADRSFYRKAVLACEGRVWHEVAFEYPTQTQDRISEFVSRAAEAVRNSEDQGCEASESTAVGETPALKVPTPPSSPQASSSPPQVSSPPPPTAAP
jgi:hypothetical protein